MIDTLALAIQYLMLDYGEQFAIACAVGTFATLSALLRRESAR
jgi:hypothetical protein